MRLLPALLLLACSSAPDPAPAAPPAPRTAEPPAEPVRLEAHRRVNWGYGCGGNCAQNTRGESTMTIAADGADARVEDVGAIRTTHHSGSFGLDTVGDERRWAFTWTGTLEDGDTAMKVRLAAGGGRCQERARKGMAPCRHPAPSRLVLACTRDQVEIDQARRPVWRCEADPPIPPGEWSGTPFPWIFGIDDPIDTVHAGEPQPRTSYELSRARPGSPP